MCLSLHLDRGVLLIARHEYGGAHGAHSFVFRVFFCGCPFFLLGGDKKTAPVATEAALPEARRRGIEPLSALLHRSQIATPLSNCRAGAKAGHQTHLRDRAAPEAIFTILLIVEFIESSISA